jgi:Na+/melibiose symporter-like transporter
LSDWQEYYSLKRKILISLISGGSVLVTVIVTSSFMKFYTDVVGLSPATYGVIFLIFSIWNGINDPIIGYWADKRPFLTACPSTIGLPPGRTLSFSWAMVSVPLSTLQLAGWW